MYDEQYFTRDAAHVTLHETDGVTLDDENEPTIDWDEVTVERVDDPPHAEAFDTKRFYKLPATVARPIKQPYTFNDTTVHFKKPRQELKKAAWSLDNAPWTMDHPDTGVVKDVDDVRGFWGNPRYVDATDDLDADLHVPVDDSEAKQFIQNNNDVSVGFYNKVQKPDDYDGIVGDADDTSEDELDGYQVDLYFDHVASVGVGRCPGEKGCGIDAAHGHTSPFKGSLTTEVNSEKPTADSGTEMKQTTDQPSGIKTHDGQWFAVGPGEHTKDSTDHPGDHMFPVDSCADIEDAWNLRGSAEDLTIEESTLAARIVRAAEAKDCSGMPSTLQEQMDSSACANKSAGCAVRTRDASNSVPDNEADCGGGCGCGCSGDCEEDGCGNNETHDILNMDFDIDTSDLRAEAVLDKLAEEHDEVADRLEKLRQNDDAADKARKAADELDVEVDELPEAVGMVTDERDELQERVDELAEPQKEEHAEAIVEATDRFGDKEDLLEMDLDELEQKRELVEDLTGSSETTDTVANSGTDDGGSTETTDNNISPSERKYAKTPW